LLVETSPNAKGFTVGICASDSAEGLPELLTFLLSEDFGSQFSLRRIVIVASGCPLRIVEAMRKVASTDPRISLQIEERRRGKADAINQIIASSSGAFLVMVNGDAFPESGAIRRLLDVAVDPSVGVVSATPYFEDKGGLLHQSLSLMWSAHSTLSFRLNHAGTSNHACDELIAVRKNILRRLPANLVNDGAFMGGVANSRGFKVRFSKSAKVKITVPRTLFDLIRQRRRIIFGHVQVWKELGHPPRTIESMMFMDPLASLRTVVSVLSERPRLITAFPIVLAGEFISILMGAFDTIRSTDRHAIWRRNVE
jgi:cellulose synthase/poly-beta-1,6-N-acetylglucosamine synthase-like glycosyltransferase